MICACITSAVSAISRCCVDVPRGIGEAGATEQRNQRDQESSRDSSAVALDRMGVVDVRPAWYFWPVPRAFAGR